MQSLVDALERLREGTEYEFDGQVAVALILAIRAGCRNVLFRVRHDDPRIMRASAGGEEEEDELIDALSREVSWILHNLFAVDAVPVDCRSLTDRHAFHLALLSPASINSKKPSRVASPRRSASHPATPVTSTVVPSPTSARSRVLTNHASYTAEPDQADDSSAGEDLYPPAQTTATGRVPTAQRKRFIEARRHNTASLISVDAAKATPTEERDRALRIGVRTLGRGTQQQGPPDLPQGVILRGLNAASPSAQQAMIDMARERRIVIPNSSPTGPLSGSWNVPDSFITIGIVLAHSPSKADDWGVPPVNRYLLDRFDYSCTVQSRYYDPPPTFSHPLASTVIPISMPTVDVKMAAAMDTYVLDLLSTIRHHPMLDSRMLTARARTQLVLLTRTWVALTRGPSSSITDDQSLHVEPEDVLPVLLGAVGHRLRMLEPRDEKSLFWGSELAALEARRRVVRGSGSGTGARTGWMDVSQVLHDIVQRV